MTYVWEKNDTFTQHFISGDVVYIRIGGKPLPFGAQVLTKRGQA